MTYTVNLPKDKLFLLRMILPTIGLQGDYSDVVYSPSGKSVRNSRVCIILGRNGFDLTSPLGLSNFLVELGLFTEVKCRHLQADTFGSIQQLFRRAAHLVVLARAPKSSEEDEQWILSILKKPFLERCIIAREEGWRRVIFIVLSAIEKRFDPLAFEALSRTQKEYYRSITVAFRKAQFMEISLRDDPELDCVEILRCF